MSLTAIYSPKCNSEQHRLCTTYSVASGKKREIRHCIECDNYFSETSNTPLVGLRTPLLVIIQVLKVLNNGLSINATRDTFSVTKKSIKRWLMRLGSLRETLLLYSLCQQFIQ